MNTPNQQDWQQRLQELEIEVQQTPNSEQTQAQSPTSHSTPNTAVEWQAKWQQIAVWFSNLPSIAKAVVAIIALSVSFSLLKMVFQLVSALIGMAFIGAVLYGVYRFAIAPQSSRS
ncbi:MAG: hypothetical protein SAJ12_11905 [Jaaginema sp. PMC 1079.18]|nr:hypothetical protein [Jaaginema sp. PMC 1080.18]MEC4851710.1 hypothetical protein [Jaaginema sp. PMC 1079.18]MEC4868408.1 hypothetical protein [Jaaginema sp. PMC 1078.18]